MASTQFERIAGFRALHRGMKIEVEAVRRDGRWVAREVEISGGDDDDRGGDDHGDDHGDGDDR